MRTRRRGAGGSTSTTINSPFSPGARLGRRTFIASPPGRAVVGRPRSIFAAQAPTSASGGSPRSRGGSRGTQGSARCRAGGRWGSGSAPTGIRTPGSGRSPSNGAAAPRPRREIAPPTGEGGHVPHLEPICAAAHADPDADPVPRLGEHRGVQATRALKGALVRRGIRAVYGRTRPPPPANRGPGPPLVSQGRARLPRANAPGSRADAEPRRAARRPRHGDRSAEARPAGTTSPARRRALRPRRGRRAGRWPGTWAGVRRGPRPP